MCNSAPFPSPGPSGHPLPQAGEGLRGWPKRQDSPLARLRERGRGRGPSQSGFTLVEMIIAIIIISVGLAGLLAAFNVGVRGSVDPLIQKQMLAAAEGLMEEILLKPYDVNGAPPTNGSTECGAAASRQNFDDVRDYAGYQTIGICDIYGASVPGLGAYGVLVNVAPITLDGVANTLQVTVTVSRGSDSVQLLGFRAI